MKTLKKIFSLFLIAVLYLGCSSSDDSSVIADSPFGTGIISFGVTPIEILRNMQTGELMKKQVICSSSEWKYVRVAIRDSQGNCFYGNSETGFQELEMDPLGIDTNNDKILDTWNTSSNNKLLLPVGNYTLEYLAVTNNKGRNSEIILMSPKKGEEDNATQYYNLVNNSLPITFSIADGQEQFIPIEALCFTMEHAYEFGFIFLSYEDPNPFYLCSQ